VNSRQYREKVLTSFACRDIGFARRALGLLIVVIIVPLLSRGNGRLGWCRWV